jgi:DNA polymerase-3 subunit beta
MLLIKTKRDNILTPLQSVCGIVEKRHTLPILSNVLIEKSGDQLTLLATDIEIQIRTHTAGAAGCGKNRRYGRRQKTSGHPAFSA